MADPRPEENESTPTEREREWRVTRCAHGCVHVTLDRVTLTLSEHEFYALQTLLRLASERWRGAGLTAEGGGRPH